VIKEELVGVRPGLDGVKLALALVGDPGPDQALAEDISCKQELVIALERIQDFAQGAGR
jgi:hypothetical protein